MPRHMFWFLFVSWHIHMLLWKQRRHFLHGSDKVENGQNIQKQVSNNKRRFIRPASTCTRVFWFFLFFLFPRRQTHTYRHTLEEESVLNPQFHAKTTQLLNRFLILPAYRHTIKSARLYLTASTQRRAWIKSDVYLRARIPPLSHATHKWSNKQRLSPTRWVFFFQHSCTDLGSNRFGQLNLILAQKQKQEQQQQKRSDNMFHPCGCQPITIRVTLLKI